VIALARVAHRFTLTRRASFEVAQFVAFVMELFEKTRRLRMDPIRLARMVNLTAG
jgi:hypothetical protein